MRSTGTLSPVTLWDNDKGAVLNGIPDLDLFWICSENNYSKIIATEKKQLVS